MIDPSTASFLEAVYSTSYTPSLVLVKNCKNVFALKSLFNNIFSLVSALYTVVLAELVILTVIFSAFLSFGYGFPINIFSNKDNFFL